MLGLKMPVAKLLSRTCNPLGINYRIRPPKPGQQYRGLAPVQCRITVYGKQDSGFSVIWEGKKVVIDPAKWNKRTRRSSVRGDEVNDLINEHERAIALVFQKQRKRGWKPTLESVKYEFLSSEEPVYLGEDEGYYFPLLDTGKRRSLKLSKDSTLLTAYEAYMQTSGVLNNITLKGRLQKALIRIEKFLNETGQVSLKCNQITVGWAKRYHAWLITQPVGRKLDSLMSKGHASRQLGFLSRILSWLHEDDYMSNNPLYGIKWPRHDDKEVCFLEGDQVAKVFLMNKEGCAGIALWWIKLMMLTGMDYPDAIKYAKNRSEYEVSTPHGVIISGKRNKSPHNQFDIPMLTQISELFRQFPDGPEVLSAHTINRYSSLLEKPLDFKSRFTIKTARKTAGVLFLHAGYEIAEVSRILGHSSIRTTERYYVKVTRSMVLRGMMRVAGSDGSNSNRELVA